MVEEFTELLTELAGLTPGQFLLLSLSLAASVCLGFPAQTRFRVPGFPMRALATLIWFGSWVAMPNALVDWYTQRRARLSLPKEVFNAPREGMLFLLCYVALIK